MARKIAEITESQWTDALIASGFSAAEVKLYTEKLISRRDHMLSQLSFEFKKLRPAGTRTSFDFDPTKEDVPTSSTGVKAPINGLKVVKGKAVAL